MQWAAQGVFCSLDMFPDAPIRTLCVPERSLLLSSMVEEAWLCYFMLATLMHTNWAISHNIQESTESAGEAGTWYRLTNQTYYNNTALPTGHAKRQTYKHTTYHVLHDENKIKVVALTDYGIQASQVLCNSTYLQISSVDSISAILTALVPNDNQTVAVSGGSSMTCSGQTIMQHVLDWWHSGTTLTIIGRRAHITDILSHVTLNYQTNHLLKKSTTASRATRGMKRRENWVYRTQTETDGGPHLSKGRRMQVQSWWDDAWDYVTDAATDAVDDVVSVTDDVVSDVTTAADFVATGEASGSDTVTLFDTSFDQSKDFDDGLLTIQGTGSVDVSLEIDLQIADYTISSFSVTVTGDFNAGVTATFTYDYAKSDSDDATIYTLTLSDIDIQIGPFPLIVTPSIPINAGYSLDIEATLTATASATAEGSATFGFTYTPSANPTFAPVSTNSFSYDYDYSGWDAAATIAASVYIMPQLAFDLEFLGGPSVGVQISLDLADTFDNTASCTNVLTVGVSESVILGASVDISLAGYDLLTATAGPWTLVSYSQTLYTYATPSGCSDAGSSRTLALPSPGAPSQGHPRALPTPRASSAGSLAAQVYSGHGTPIIPWGTGCQTFIRHQNMSFRLTTSTPTLVRFTATISTITLFGYAVTRAVYDVIGDVDVAYGETSTLNISLVSNRTVSNSANTTGTDPYPPASLTASYSPNVFWTSIVAQDNCMLYEVVTPYVSNTKTAVELNCSTCTTDQKLQYIYTTYGRSNFQAESIEQSTQAARQSIALATTQNNYVSMDNMSYAALLADSAATTSLFGDVPITFLSFGSTASCAQVVSVSPGDTGFTWMGLQPRTASYSWLMSVDRLTQSGDIVYNETIVFQVPCPNGPLSLTVYSYSSQNPNLGITGVDILTDGGTIVAKGSMCQVTAMHTSSFAAVETDDNWYLYLLFLLLLAPVLMIPCCIYWYRQREARKHEEAMSIYFENEGVLEMWDNF